MTAKMQGPDNHGGLSHDGISYEPDEKGQIEVPEHVVPHAFDHGFTLVTDDVTEGAKGKEVGGTPDLAKMKKADLIAFAKDNLGLELDAAKTNKEMIAEIEAATAAKAAEGSQADGTGAE